MYRYLLAIVPAAENIFVAAPTGPALSELPINVERKSLSEWIIFDIFFWSAFIDKFSFSLFVQLPKPKLCRHHKQLSKLQSKLQYSLHLIQQLSWVTLHQNQQPLFRKNWNSLNVSFLDGFRFERFYSLGTNIFYLFKLFFFFKLFSLLFSFNLSSSIENRIHLFVCASNLIHRWPLSSSFAIRIPLRWPGFANQLLQKEVTFYDENDHFSERQNGNQSHRKLIFANTILMRI